MRTLKAFVLIKTAPGKEREAMDKVFKVPEVSEIHMLTGDWDLLAVVQTEREIVLPTDEEALELVLDKITPIRHIQRTSTIVPTFSTYKT